MRAGSIAVGGLAPGSMISDGLLYSTLVSMCCVFLGLGSRLWVREDGIVWVEFNGVSRVAWRMYVLWWVKHWLSAVELCSLVWGYVVWDAWGG
ncbi:hypothetical protein P167DRAFT_134478 [Morchella conica CCBAS932]|uniref:Transmembrane protein n=1 Tax=Morchella conica CCBAS932 TaxID=1392247 RepID=A0A3N4KRQ7_9PEZI|nr:hypothetical protein P167DRAFT_134478 [Morchella conica CCBAS932]